MRALALLLLLWSCHRQSNDWNEAALYCGNNMRPNRQYIALPKIQGRLEAVAIGDSQGFVPQLISKQCVEVPGTFTGQIFYRDDEGGGRIDVGPSGFFYLIGSQNEVLSKKKVLASCQEAVVSRADVPISWQEQNADRPLVFNNQVSLYSLDNELVYQASLGSGQGVLRLDDPALPEGQYRLHVTSRELFEYHSVGTEVSSQCDVTIDRTSPEVTVSLDQQDLLREGVVKLNENESISFSVADANPLYIRFCLQPAGDDRCDDNENFRIGQDFVPAPDSGEWQLVYFATDEAGNQSTPETRSFGIYHNQTIELLRKEFANATLKSLVGQSEEAFATFQNALDGYQTLELQEEKQDLRWDIVQAFWSLDESFTFLDAVSLASIRFLQPLPYSSGGFLARDQYGELYLVDQGKVDPLASKISDVEPLVDGRILSLDRDGVVRVHRGSDLVFEKKLGARLRNPKISFNSKLQSYIFYGSSQAYIFQGLREDGEPAKVLSYSKGGRGTSARFKFSSDNSKILFSNLNEFSILRPDTLTVEDSLTVAPSCAINDFFELGDQFVFVTRKSRTLGSPSDHPCGVFTWNQKNKQKQDYSQDTIGYTGIEQAVLAKRDQSGYLLFHNRNTDYFYTGKFDMAAQFPGAFSFIEDRDSLEVSYLQVNQKQTSFLSLSTGAVSVRPVPVIAFDDAPLVKIPLAAKAVSFSGDDKSLFIATEDRVERHRIHNSLQGRKHTYTNRFASVPYDEKAITVDVDEAKERLVAYDFLDQEIQVMNYSMNPLFTLKTLAPVVDVQALGDGVFWADRQGHIWQWSIKTGTNTKIITSGEAIDQIIVSPSGAAIVVLAGGEVFIYSLVDNQFQRTRLALSAVLAIKPSPSGEVFVAVQNQGFGSSYYHEVFSFDGKMKGALSGDHEADFDPQGARLAVVEGQSIRVLDISRGGVTDFPLEVPFQASRILFLENGFVLSAFNSSMIYHQQAPPEILEGFQVIVAWDDYLLGQNRKGRLILRQKGRELASTSLGGNAVFNVTRSGKELLIHSLDQDRVKSQRLVLDVGEIQHAVNSWGL